MKAIRSFVVAAREPVSARSAFERARLLARAGDRIVLAHVERGGFLQLLGEGELRHAIPDGQLSNWTSTSWLEELGRSIDTDPTVTVETVLLRGEPAVAIGDYARSIGAAAIIVATHREGVVREIVIGSTTLRILRHAPCPVVVTRRGPVREYRKAVAAVALDPAAERVIEATLGLLPEAELTLLHVYRIPNESRWRINDVGEKALLEPIRKHLQAEAEHEMAKLHTLAPLAKVSLQYGFAASEIFSLVLREWSDVLVISQHRGSLRHERAIGSVPQFLLYNCLCDLVLVP